MMRLRRTKLARPLLMGRAALPAFNSLMSCTVEQRTREIGIRMALGAGRADMLKLVLAQGIKLTLSGVIGMRAG